MQVRELELVDAVTSEAIDLRLKLRDECPVSYVVRYKKFPICTLLTTTPINQIWRFSWVNSTPYNSWILEWERLLERELIGNKRLLVELRVHRLKKRSAPMGYWLVGGNEYEDSSRLMMTGVWYDNWRIPESMLGAVISFQERWIQQLGQQCFIQRQDEVEIREVQEALLAVEVKEDQERSKLNRLFGFSALYRPGLNEWLGDDGLIAQLRQIVGCLESGKKDFVIQEIERDKLRLYGFGERQWLWHDGYWSWALEGRPEHVTPENFDLIFAYRARVTRILGLPQYYYYIKDVLDREEALAEKHPISNGLPYHPFEELHAYLVDMETKFPILTEEPFPRECFPTTLD
jgi:hypothetical protein